MIGTLGAPVRRGPLGRRRAAPPAPRRPVRGARDRDRHARDADRRAPARRARRALAARRRPAGRGRPRHRRPQPRRCTRSGSPTADPGVAPLTRARALAVRVGVGAGEQVADGRWASAALVPPPAAGRGSRTAGLRPTERLAAMLANRDVALACEELTLRARADADAGRWRDCAFQLRARLRRRAHRAAAVGRPGRHRRAPRRARRAAARRRGAADAAREGGIDDAADRRRHAGAGAPGGGAARPHQRPARRLSAAVSRARRARRRSASSSSTTSPSSRTSARASNGVGPCVTIATAPPAARVTPGSCATGWTSSELPMHSSTSAPRRELVRALERARAAGTRRTGRRRASAAPAVAARHAVRRRRPAAGASPSSGYWSPHTRHELCSIVPCTSTISRVPGLAVQHVDVLGDHGVEQRRGARARRARGARRWAPCPRASGSASP